MRLILLSFVLSISMTGALMGDTYVSGQGSQQNANIYKPTKTVGIRLLANRDLTPWLSQVQGREALDYGSGLGFSADYLTKQSFHTIGVDVSASMVETSQSMFPELEFLHTTEALPFAAQQFSLVFSSFVLFELSSKEALVAYIKEGARVLAPNGVFIATIASPELYNPAREWGTINAHYPQNADAKSGSLVKASLVDLNLTFEDYFWTEADYREAFAAAGLEVFEVLYPLGKADEDMNWKDELTHSPVMLIRAGHGCH